MAILLLLLMRLRFLNARYAGSVVSVPVVLRVVRTPVVLIARYAGVV